MNSLSAFPVCILLFFEGKSNFMSFYKDTFLCKSILLITVKQESLYWLKSERHGKVEDKGPMPSCWFITVVFQGNMQR